MNTLYNVERDTHNNNTKDDWYETILSRFSTAIVFTYLSYNKLLLTLLKPNYNNYE